MADTREAKKRTSCGTTILIAALAGLALTCVYILVMSTLAGGRSSTPSTTAEIVTINARDETGAPLPGGLVNVWDNYQTRTRVVTKCADGERVTMLGRAGDGVEIRTGSGAHGWVTYWFIRELR